MQRVHLGLRSTVTLPQKISVTRVGLIFYDETHVYMSKTINFPSLGLMDVDLLDRTVSNFASTVIMAGWVYGPDGRQIYVLENLACRVQAARRLPGSTGSPALRWLPRSFQGLNFAQPAR